MGDSSFSCPNQNIPKPKGVRVSSQKEVGNAYYQYLQSVMAEPYVVGWHFCGFIEGSPDLKKFHHYFSIQNGLLKPDGTPYQETINRVIEANKNAYSWHASANAEQEGTLKTLFSNLTELFYSYLYDSAGRCNNVTLKECVFTTIDNNIFTVGSFKGKTPVPQKNISWVVTEEGVVVIDTGTKQSATVAKRKIRETTDKPIKYIIYTHHHGTQVAGASVLKDPETKIIAHEDLIAEFDLYTKFYRYNARRDFIQFNLPFDFNKVKPHNFIYPDITYKTEYRFTLGGITFELYHVVGEAPDYTIIFLPGQKVVWSGDLTGGMPLVASPMKRVRDEVKWKEGLEFIKSLKPEILIQSVQPPFCDQALIMKKLDSMIDYFDFLHESIAREMNSNSSLEETLHSIKLPEHMKTNPLLKERYGSLQFNVRGLYHRYSGWFDQNGTSLNIVPSKERAEHFIADMGGDEKVLQHARELEQNKNYKLALEYLDLLIAAETKLKDAHQTKSEILMEMSKHYKHRMTINMYKRLATIEKKKAVELAKEGENEER
jgi:glyoxylase-like metal-dependent hydrolase (beta-lactamase superfamily II)